MLYVISGYILSVVVIHILLFLRSDDISKVLMMNSAISCLAVAMLLLAFYFKDTNFIDVIFFYIIMSPIGFYGIFLYYKYRYAKKQDNEANSNDTAGSNNDEIKINDETKARNNNKLAKKNADRK